ncbi:MAG TPA: aminotransferase class III-fold pyridoxal phosphate-dependent enzyme, partial [Chthoniobacterales bacterium]|nr:aminotransferase class III-fold pyridoxal phosphate-dependent enzyme [Chthoniobacterales bacterium]
MRAPVNFMQGMAQLANHGCNVMLEIGPQPVLQMLGRQNWTGPKVRWLTSLWAIRDDWKQLQHSLGELYVQGAKVDWKRFDQPYARRRVHLPTYAFRRQRYWTNVCNSPPRQEPPVPAPAPSAVSVAVRVQSMIAGLLELDPSEIEWDRTFVELGADSLLLSRLVQNLRAAFGVELEISQLFEEFDRCAPLIAHLERVIPPTMTQNHAAPRNDPANDSRDVTVSAAPLEQIQQQLAAIAQQLANLQGQQDSAPAPPAGKTRPIKSGAGRAATLPPEPRRDTAGAKLTRNQQQQLNSLIARHSAKTVSSKRRAIQHCARRTDVRSMRMFRAETRELAYPIIGFRADGAHFWDIDGNEYVDIAMGVGVHLCGHNPPFITQGVQQQLEKGIQLGPLSDLADDVAASICSLTGSQRVFFQVTGTDAVNGALRVAQAATGRSKFVMFSGSYHGQADRTLGIPDVQGDPLRSIPMSLGISPRAVGDAIVLPYGHPKALATIEAHRADLAAVLVEPVQSRNPALQPKAFLSELRQLTTDEGIALIFDEIITGFRAHPGGVQALFGIEADLVTYGKCLGGGMPVSAVAGKSNYIDRVDGGASRFVNSSLPTVETTFIGSTFAMHPIAMAAARSMLEHLEKAGPSLQEELNRRTGRLADDLNALFTREQVPIKVLQFSSLFRFTWKGNTSYTYQPLEMEVFHFHLINKGVYIWEGRTCFLSTAHTDSDLETIFRAVEETIGEMRAADFLANAVTTSGPAPNRPQFRQDGQNDAAPFLQAQLSEEQALLLAIQQSQKTDAPQWCIVEQLQLRGPLDLEVLGRAVWQVVDRHEALRTVFREDGRTQLVLARLDVELGYQDFSH